MPITSNTKLAVISRATSITLLIIPYPLYLPRGIFIPPPPSELQRGMECGDRQLIRANRTYVKRPKKGNTNTV